MDFIYGRPMEKGLYTWYCQVPGYSWKTDPILGWELVKDTGFAWFLIDPDGNRRSTEATKLADAMFRAAKYIKGEGKQG